MHCKNERNAYNRMVEILALSYYRAENLAKVTKLIFWECAGFSILGWVRNKKHPLTHKITKKNFKVINRFL